MRGAEIFFVLYIWLYAVSVEETFRKANNLPVPYCEGEITNEGWEFGCFSSVVLNPNLYRYVAGSVSWQGPSDKPAAPQVTNTVQPMSTTREPTRFASLQW